LIPSGDPPSSTTYPFAVQPRLFWTVFSAAIEMGLHTVTARVEREIRLWTLVLRDPRTPQISKWLLGAALAHLASPVDIVPDFIPVLGQLDDLVIVPMLVWVAVRFIPEKSCQNAGGRFLSRRTVFHHCLLAGPPGKHRLVTGSVACLKSMKQCHSEECMSK